MKWTIIAAALMASVALMPVQPAQARGCVKGAIIGGIAGHFLGHHGALGAAAGCAIGHHEDYRRDRYYGYRHDNGYYR